MDEHLKNEEGRILGIIIKIVISIIGLDWEKIGGLLARKPYKFIEDNHEIEFIEDERKAVHRRATVIKTRKKKTTQIKIRDYEIFRKYGSVSWSPSCTENGTFSIMHAGADPGVVCFSEHALEDKRSVCRTVEIEYLDCRLGIIPPTHTSRRLRPGPEIYLNVNDATDSLLLKLYFKKTKCAGAQIEKVVYPERIYKHLKEQPSWGPDLVELHLHKPDIGSEYRISTWFQN